MTGAGLEWWELVTLNGTTITDYPMFQQEILNYFEPVNRELTARKMLSELKQMGKLTIVRDYNREFSKWLLQIPSMTAAEQIFHYSQGLKTRTRIEVERSEPNTLQDAMKIADRLDSLYAEKMRRVEKKLCFVCGKPNCIARNHYNNNSGRSFSKPTNFHQKKN